jgi:hypothetical protein
MSHAIVAFVPAFKQRIESLATGRLPLVTDGDRVRRPAAREDRRLDDVATTKRAGRSGRWLEIPNPTRSVELIDAPIRDAKRPCLDVGNVEVFRWDLQLDLAAGRDPRVPLLDAEDAIRTSENLDHALLARLTARVVNGDARIETVAYSESVSQPHTLQFIGRTVFCNGPRRLADGARGVAVQTVAARRCHERDRNERGDGPVAHD